MDNHSHYIQTLGTLDPEKEQSCRNSVHVTLSLMRRRRLLQYCEQRQPLRLYFYQIHTPAHEKLDPSCCCVEWSQNIWIQPSESAAATSQIFISMTTAVRPCFTASWHDDVSWKNLAPSFASRILLQTSRCIGTRKFRVGLYNPSSNCSQRWL